MGHRKFILVQIPQFLTAAETAVTRRLTAAVGGAVIGQTAGGVVVGKGGERGGPTQHTHVTLIYR